jgi:hypothetical protein
MGKGTSGDVMFVPPPNVGRQGTGETPKRSLEYAPYMFVLHLYNTSFSVMLATILAMFQNKSPDNERNDMEPEGRLQCEQFQENSDS